jgi:hypothetical protein
MKTVADVVIEKLEEAVAIRKGALAKGAVSSYEEYKYITGVIAGLQGALDALKDAQRTVIDED